MSLGLILKESLGVSWKGYSMPFDCGSALLYLETGISPSRILITFFVCPYILLTNWTSCYMQNMGIIDPGGGGGFSSMIWVGTCCWDLKRRPVFIPNFAEKCEPFLYQSHKLQAKFTKNVTLFSKIVKLSSQFRKFWYQIDEIGPILRQFKTILKTWPMFIPVFALYKGHCYTKRLILRPISAARPRIYLCTKNPPPRGHWPTPHFATMFSHGL